MDLNLISDIDLETLEEELNNGRLSFKDVANYVSELMVDGNHVEQMKNDDLKDQYEQSLKLIKISQVLLRYAIEKLTKEESGDRYVFQCTNCSKAFRKSEYLENHIQRRHSTKSLAENGLYPLIEQIKRYNGLFVESSSLEDLKIEIKNLQSCLKETSEDLIKERTAREQLQRIIESEIIEKLNLLQETWSEVREENKMDDERSTVESGDNNSNEESASVIDPQLKKQQENHQSSKDWQPKSASDQVKDGRDFDLFLMKQNELIDKLGQNIDRFVERNDESKLNDKQLQSFISTTIHKEIESLLVNKELVTNHRKDDLELKEKKSGKKTNSRRFLMNSKEKKESAKSGGVDEERRESLHEFSVQNHHLNNTSQIKDHTDEIVHEIDRMIGDEVLSKNQTKAQSFTSKIRKFPFKFRKSKSLIQLNGEEENAIKEESREESLRNGANDFEKILDDNTVNDDDKDESQSNEKSKDIKNEIEKVNDKPTISRFRQFVWKKSDSVDNQDQKISLNKFSTKPKSDEISVKNESNVQIEKTIDNRTVVNQIDRLTTPTMNELKTLKSVLKKSNSTDKNLQQAKLPKKSIAFSDERIEFSAEELEDSSDSSYSFSGNHVSNSSTIYKPANAIDYSMTTGGVANITTDYPLVHKLDTYIMQPKEQTVTVQKVIEIERPIPAPRFVQQNTLTSL